MLCVLPEPAHLRMPGPSLQGSYPGRLKGDPGSAGAPGAEGVPGLPVFTGLPGVPGPEGAPRTLKMLPDPENAPGSAGVPGDSGQRLGFSYGP